MQYEDTVLVKVDRETKDRMKKINTNWSEIIRAAIAEEVNRQKNLAKAVAIMDRIFARHRRSKEDSTKVIRYWRDHRYGPSSG